MFLVPRARDKNLVMLIFLILILILCLSMNPRYSSNSETLQIIEPLLRNLSDSTTAIRFYKVDVDAHSDICNIAGGFHVMPTIVLYKGGSQVDCMTGANPKGLSVRSLSVSVCLSFLSFSVYLAPCCLLVDAFVDPLRHQSLNLEVYPFISFTTIHPQINPFALYPFYHFLFPNNIFHKRCRFLVHA